MVHNVMAMFTALRSCAFAAAVQRNKSKAVNRTVPIDAMVHTVMVLPTR